jgi:hypothetical protein
MIKYLKDKTNFLYLIFLLIGAVFGTYKYDFNSTILAIGIIVLFTTITSLVIQFFKNQKKFK